MRTTWRSFLVLPFCWLISLPAPFAPKRSAASGREASVNSASPSVVSNRGGGTGTSYSRTSASPSRSWFFCTMQKTRSGPSSRSIRLTRSLLDSPGRASFRSGRTRSPVSLAVSCSCCSSVVRSVTTTTLKPQSPGWVRSLRTNCTMVMLLPEPWVCQIMPPRSSRCLLDCNLVAPVAKRAMAFCTARYC